MKLRLGGIVSLFFSSVLFAQTGTLIGTVTDESGAIVPGAKIRLTANSGVASTAVAGGDGSYSFRGVAPGDYVVQATAPDLATPLLKLTLRSGVQTLNLQLKVARVEQQVTVEDRAVTVSPEPANNASATLLAGDDLQALSDNPDDLIAELIAIAGQGAGPGGASVFIDGFSGGQLGSKESIREIRINQNPFSAEYDRIGTGRVEILTKPGTNQFHGSGFFNFGNDFWNSRNPYASKKAPFLLRETGGNLSGPIGKRASFFFDLRRDAVDNGAIINGTTLNPTTLGIVNPFTDVFRTPQVRIRSNPRADYQLSANNTLTLRYGFLHANIPSAGVGGFNLISRGAHATGTTHTIQATETAVFAENMVNEIRYQLFRSSNQITPDTIGPTLQVLGAFNGGASPEGHSFDTQTNHEFQDYLSVLHGQHSWRFGMRLRRQVDDNISPQNFNGTFTFSGGVAPVLEANNQAVLDSAGQPILTPITSIERYRRTVLLQSLGFPPLQIARLGGGASQFSIISGDPNLSVSQFDFGAFVSDDWKIKPSLTMSLGLRYEAQTNISDRHDFAPRVGIAWGFAPKTVARAGFGIFYDRFGLANTMTALRSNGIRQQQYIVTNPDFFPSLPPLSILEGFQSMQVRQRVNSNLVAPSLYQSMISIERELSRNTTVAATFAHAHGLHMLRSRDINAPLPGTYNPAVPGSGVYPFGPVGALFLMESSGLYNQHQLIVNVNSRANKHVSLTGTYSLNHAMSNTDGIGTFPANPYSMAGEYGPASTDVRHRVTFGGSISTKWNVTLSPLINITAGPPFDITAGRDIYGTTLFNGRPGIATDRNKPDVIQTVYGLLNPNPTPDERILPRNYGRGPGTIFFNAHVVKSTKVGPKPAEAADGKGGTRPYTLTFTMEIVNLLNHTNPGPIIGNITSPLFGRANQPAGGAGFAGFSEAANNRRFELQTRFTF
jgi:Carboxypeptidase regulatory-like domain